MPSLLALVPHPDDEAYAFGGTVALAAEAGWRCIVVCASSGEQGERHDGGHQDPASVAAARESELNESCRILGAEPPLFWRLPDGRLGSYTSQAYRVREMLEDFDPEILLALGPDGAYGHPDHLAVYRWLMDGWASLPRELRPAILFSTFPRGLFLPQYELCISMMGDPPVPAAAALGADLFDAEVEIARVRDRKLAAISAHRSQLPGGDPFGLFPPGIVDRLLDHERYMHIPGLRTRTRLPGQRLE